MERVSIVRCPSTASDEEIVRRTELAIQSLGDRSAGMTALRGARKIAVKVNAGIPRVVLTDGRQTELTEPAVVEGAIRAIRAATDAEIVIGDAPTHGDGAQLYADLGYPERLKSYANVRLLDFGHGELVDVPVGDAREPLLLEGGAPMFRRYTLHRELAEADAFVSLSKMKAHKSMGCTLCIKNLFGWTPPSVYGAPRHYLHDRLIRLPRVLSDLAWLMRPCLNVVDGIVALNGSEWRGEPMRPGVIVAGTNIVATDSTAARVMGFDPEADYPDHPFLYRRNAIKLAAQRGLGPTAAAEIEVLGPRPEEVCIPFRVERYSGDTHRDDQIRDGAACAAWYREEQSALAPVHRGRVLALRNRKVVFDAPDVAGIMRWERESGLDWRSVPQMLVRCVHPDEEIETFGWYAREAERVGRAGISA